MSKKLVLAAISIAVVGTVVFAQNTITHKKILIPPTPTSAQTAPSPTLTITPSPKNIIPTTAIKTYPTPAPTQTSHSSSSDLTQYAIPLTSSSVSSSDNIPPTISFALSGFISSDGRGQMCLPLRADDNVSAGTQQFTFSHQLDGSSWSEWKSGPDAYFPCFDSLPDGSHTFSAKVKDQAGNISSTITKTFSKGTPTGTPFPQNGQPTPQSSP